MNALGTFFAIALWAKYAPYASAAFSRTVVLVLCGSGSSVHYSQPPADFIRNSSVRTAAERPAQESERVVRPRAGLGGIVTSQTLLRYRKVDGRRVLEQ